MKHNINKNKLNFRKIVPSIKYSKYYKLWIVDYFYDYKTHNYFRQIRCHRNKKQACQYKICSHESIVDSWDDVRISRKYTSWKDRTKRKHQYKYESNDDFETVHKYGNI